MACTLRVKIYECGILKEKYALPSRQGALRLFTLVAEGTCTWFVRTRHAEIRRFCLFDTLHNQQHPRPCECYQDTELTPVRFVLAGTAMLVDMG